MRDKVILIAEDNANDEELTLRALRKNNISNSIVMVRDGQEALDYLFGDGAHATRDLNQRPQVMLLDINLPKINGLEVLKRIRADERTKTMPVVILTSSAEERDRLVAYANFANSYIRKPVDFDQFTESVRELGLYWLVLNEPPPRPRAAATS
ncbi:MAG TPA: response regulator [Candidatus Limnocylindrales bacterium]|nr:response regulator [Candidatus Limnocylindrales bacterium]